MAKGRDKRRAAKRKKEEAARKMVASKPSPGDVIVRLTEKFGFREIGETLACSRGFADMLVEQGRGTIIK